MLSFDTFSILYWRSFWGQDMGSDCISSWSLLIFLFCISELLWLCRVVALKSLPVHSFNALIIPILRGCLQSLFNIPVPWYLFDTVLKVVLRAGYGIWLYQFLIIAYLYTFLIVICSDDTKKCVVLRIVNRMPPVQGDLSPVQVKEPHSSLHDYTCRLSSCKTDVCYVRLLIILERGYSSMYRKKEKDLTPLH